MHYKSQRCSSITDERMLISGPFRLGLRVGGYRQVSSHSFTLLVIGGDLSVKKWLGNLQLTTKLLVSPFTVLLLLLVFSALTYFSFSRQQSVLDDIVKNRIKRQQMVASSILDVNRLHSNFEETLKTAREIA
jgi:hypothetical protein